jgi:hypothetical protein
MRSTHEHNTTYFEFYTFSSILILLIMRRWQDGSLSISFHRPETVVPSYYFSHSSQALHSVVEFVFKCSFYLHSFRSLQPFDNSFSHYLQIPFNHISPMCLWFSSFPPLPASSICFGILSLFRRSIRPYHLNLSGYIFDNVCPL